VAQKEKIMYAEDVLLIWGIAQVGLLIWFICGEIRVERYWRKMDRRLHGLD
jgi:hypothetical protein